MSAPSGRLALVFSAIAHLFAHLFEPVFYIVALVLPAEMGMPYEQVLALITAGKILYGLAAPAAGWLGDRWSTVGMMAVYFLGLGASAVAVGFSHGPWGLAATLALCGLFGSIYHPVGISWLIRNATDIGKAVGINGIFGGIGPAVAGVAAGGLIAVAGWRAAFVVPGVACLLVGVAFTVLVMRRRIVEVKADRRPMPAPSRGEVVRAGVVLSVTMLCAGLIYQAVQPALPKLFEERLGEAGILAASAGVTAVYLVAGLTQVVAGHMADRWSPRLVYVGAAAAQIPLLLGLAALSGLPLVAAATAAVTGNMAGIPAENILVARYSPAKWRGTAFGMKYLLGFGVSGLGVLLVSVMHSATGSFTQLFVLLAALAATAAAAGLLLPADRG